VPIDGSIGLIQMQAEATPYRFATLMNYCEKGLTCCPVAAATRNVKNYGEKGPALADRGKEVSPPKEESGS
jgi:hypothetical protein